MAIADVHEHSWDELLPFAAIARTHPAGMIDLTIGNPVDPAPQVAIAAIVASAEAHAYPLIEGTNDLVAAIARWYERRRGVPGLTRENIMPTIGSKELVAMLPLLLGVGPGDVVVYPRAAYPSYAVGAQLAGATAFASDDPAEWPAETRIAWINSPGNPDGRILGIPDLRVAVAAARARGAVLASDECYIELGWDGEWEHTRVPSVLDPAVTDGDLTGLLSVYSLSKQSNLAGYRGAFIAGDPAVVKRVLDARRHLGLMPPVPVQAATAAALDDDAHVATQKEVYRARRDSLARAVETAGFRIDSSEGGLYLWVTEGRDAGETVDRLARIGILAVPGHFYGPHFPQHVRLSLTAPDAAVARAAERLRGLVP